MTRHAQFLQNQPIEKCVLSKKVVRWIGASELCSTDIVAHYSITRSLLVWKMWGS